ncbi:DnaJ type III chaperone protein [Synechococcus sp. RS9902]|nr:J domain-containing protein [Synechococcus sp. RS9902]QNI96736.1 DnaJ type III chaperone protein [Synechococcus sp. RS9902]
MSEARPSHHERLGVRPGVDAETLRQAFRRQSKALHPDTTQLPPEQASIAFQELKESYDVLLRQSQATLSPGAKVPSSPPPLHSQPHPDAWQGIGQRRPLSGGEWFSLVLLSIALLLSLVLGLGVALAQGRDWQVSPSWLADEQTQNTSVRSQPDGRLAPGEHPAESALSPGA